MVWFLLVPVRVRVRVRVLQVIARKRTEVHHRFFLEDFVCLLQYQEQQYVYEMKNSWNVCSLYLYVYVYLYVYQHLYQQHILLVCKEIHVCLYEKNCWMDWNFASMVAMKFEMKRVKKRGKGIPRTDDVHVRLGTYGRQTDLKVSSRQFSNFEIFRFLHFRFAPLTF